MPELEYQALAAIKNRCLESGLPVKKSELLRVAVHLVGALSVAELKKRRDGLVQLKAGRPKKVYWDCWGEC